MFDGVLGVLVLECPRCEKTETDSENGVMAPPTGAEEKKDV